MLQQREGRKQIFQTPRVLGDSSAFPVVSALGGITTQPRSVRDLAVTLYGAPEDIDVDKVVDLVVVGRRSRRARRCGLRVLGGSDRPSCSSPTPSAGRQAPAR